MVTPRWAVADVGRWLREQFAAVDHIAYNAHLDDWSEVANVERRLSEVCLEHG